MPTHGEPESTREPLDPPSPLPSRRSLITEILTLQLAITGAIAAIALAGLTWTSRSVVSDNLSKWADQWAGELNELGAPFYLRDQEEAMLDVERFVAKYPEIARVTWYAPDGSVFASHDKDGLTPTADAPLATDMVSELRTQAGVSPAYLLREEVEDNRRFRLLGPIWVESFADDGLFRSDPQEADSTVELLGFVAVDLDFSDYQDAFVDSLVLASFALVGLLAASWIVGRVLLMRALRPLSQLEQPLSELAEGQMEVELPVSRHREMQAIVTALEETLHAVEKREQHLRHIADHDPLTGLYSRHRFTEELEAELVAVATHRTWSALCFVDLDQFKYINDTCGHPAGDQLLKLGADQLVESVQPNDFVARFGGDEFVLLLRNVSRSKAAAVANRVLEQMRRLNHVEQGHVFRLQCSIGIAMVASSQFSAHELIAQADMACQTAKTNGRNRIEFYRVSEKQNERMIQDVRWMRRIRDALENENPEEGDALVLHYQPLLHIASGKILHYEALLRMKTDQGLIGPQAFLPAANRFGLMAEIDRWVVEHAVEALADSGLGTDALRLSVNLSSSTFEDESFASDVRGLLERYKVSGEQIVFEVTEDMAVRFAVKTDKQIAMLRELGCEMAVDDFGTGYSSLSYLKLLPFDYLKIDGSFIKQLDTDPVDQSVVRMIGEVARAAKIKTVAEYVQTAETLRLLSEYGIDYAQGFYIGRPAPKFKPTALMAHRYLRDVHRSKPDPGSVAADSELKLP